MQELRQSTSITIKLGPFVDPATGLPVTGADIDQADVRLSKNGADLAQQNNATSNAAHDEAGVYDVTLDATDTGTLGRLDVIVNISADANTPMVVKQSYMVLAPSAYDAKYLDPVSAGILDSGIAAAVAAGTITLRSGHGLTANHMPCTVVLTGATTASKSKQTRTGTSISGDVLTISPNWTTTPDGATTDLKYIIYATPPATSAQDARLLAAATVAIIDALTGAGLSITVGAGAHTTSSCLASDATNGTLLKGRAGIVTSGSIVKQAIRFTGNIGALGAFGYSDLYGNAVVTALAENDVVTVI